VEHLNFKFGRMIRSVGAAVLPLGYAVDTLNCDSDEHDVATRRRGFVRRISRELSDRVALLASYDNSDGTGVLVYVDADGVGRE
jgi:hypothetical protein